MPARLNLGCGPRAVTGWTNVDYALGARLGRIPLLGPALAGAFEAQWDRDIVIHDLTKRFPWPDDSIEACYSSHTLEHLSREDGRRFLAETHRVLKPGGIVRIVVPDLDCLVAHYRAGEVRSVEFVEKLGVLYSNHKTGLKRALSPLVEFPHRCMYNTQDLVALLDELGFAASAADPFDSAITDIAGIEDAVRTREAVIVEGRKRAAATH